MGVTGYMGVDHLGSWDSQKEQEWGGVAERIGGQTALRRSRQFHL